MYWKGGNKMASKKVGRPRKLESAEELEKAIQHYFDSITKTEPVFDTIITGYKDEEQKKPIYKKIPALNNAGEQIERTEYFKIPTITGLCLHIGITKETWRQYGQLEEFSDPIKKAKTVIEQYNEEQLYRKDQVTGIIFNLKNNFGWKDKQEVDTNISGGLSIIKVKKPDDLDV